MAQKTKKTKTKSSSSKTTKKTSETPTSTNVAPPAKPGYITIQIADPELEAIVNLLQFSKKAFRILADKALAEADLDSHKTLNAQSLVADVLHERFQAFFSIGEPVSRDFH